MSRGDVRTFAFLTIALLLAGCADSGGSEGDDADLADDAGASAPRGSGAPSSGASGDSGATDADPARWYAFAFSREVEPKSGGSGRIQSYSYTTTKENDGAETTVDVVVTVEGVSTENVRTQKMDMASGNYEPVVVSTPLEVTKLRHEMTVVKDDAGDREAGETSVVTIWIPTGELPESSTFVWYFVKMAWEGEGGERGGWEYYVSPQMQAEQEQGGVIYLPFEDGRSGGSWWAFDLMTSMYGLSWFAPYVTGEQAFEEGSFSYGGYSQSVRRETFRIGGYAFDGWSVQLSGVSGGSSSGWMMKASEDLPIPVAFRFGSSGDGSSSVISYELTDLRLG
ncbi:MAG TPA: hypothetical protein VFH78_10220 [Candidatus Thermoplasmatota archaeon]|nr:hypothetical protein [Candidatus Thermoplasmatota archaeon]